MIFDIWKECDGESHVRELKEVAWRIVELQQKTSTRKLVDTIEEQKILEELMDKSRPALLESQASFHSLLYTPFRYPPLKNGSRFGKKTEPSLWYGALTPQTAMAEKAYYQLAFINASIGDFGAIISPMTIFSVTLKMLRGVELNKQPFLNYKDQLSSPCTYEVTQFLGQKMRSSDVDGFTFISARDIRQGINIGVFKMGSFANKYPDGASFQTWQCNTTKNTVEFVQMGSIHEGVLVFPMQDFMIDGIFPFPCIT